VDLGHLYVAKSGLQNAADAAALSGAKQLNGTAASVCCGSNSATARAIETAGKNEYFRADISDLHGTPVTITSANLWVSNCPADTCTWWPITSITSDAAAANKTFLKMDTGIRSLRTWFIQVMPGAPTSTATFGMAVAGKYLVNITPLAVCALSPTKTAENTTTHELLEFGFRRGIAYNIPDLNPLGASGVPMWVNPVDSYPGSCDPNHASTSFTTPFVCDGSSSSITTLPTKVYVSTGTSSALERALNSRFDIYQGNTCDPVSAPPDTNIHAFQANPAGSATGQPRDWMNTANNTTPTQQTISLMTGSSGRKVPLTPLTFNQYGALWSASRAVQVDGSTPPKAGTAFSASNSSWSTLYGGTIDITANGYPTPSDSTASPYGQSSGKYNPAPPSHTGTPNRRILNVAIVDCDSLAGGGLSCSQIDVLGIGKFFMQVPADFGGNPKKIEAEFTGLIEQLPPADIRLYR
jgi:Flp pilus assembly protein TadG